MSSGRLYRRFDADDRYRKLPAQNVCGCSGCGIAGQNNSFGPFLQKEVDDGTRSLHDETFRLVTPGRVSAIGAVEKLLVGQFLAKRFQNRESSQTGIENTDRIACRRHDFYGLVLSAAARPRRSLTAAQAGAEGGACTRILLAPQASRSCMAA